MPGGDRLLRLEAELLRSLGHPTRLRILELLRDGERCVCEITETLELEQANVSQHLTVLRQQDLVGYRKDGSRVIYRVSHPEVFDLLRACRQTLQAQTRATAVMLEEGEL